MINQFVLVAKTDNPSIIIAVALANSIMSRCGVGFYNTQSKKLAEHLARGLVFAHLLDINHVIPGAIAWIDVAGPFEVTEGES